MRKDELLKGFYTYRFEVALDQHLKNSKAYKESNQDALKEYESLDGMGLTHEQSKKVDVIISAYNYAGSVYGEEAYKFGFWDGVRLMRLLHEPGRR